MTTPSNQAINALAFLMHEMRPDWDTPGCVAALRKCPNVGLALLVIAAARYAADARHETPAHLADLGNHSWDSDWYPPCRIHPQTKARRLNGQCAACWADSQEKPAPPMNRGGRPIPPDARELMLAALTQRPTEEPA